MRSFTAYDVLGQLEKRSTVHWGVGGARFGCRERGSTEGMLHVQLFTRTHLLVRSSLITDLSSGGKNSRGKPKANGMKESFFRNS